MPRQEIESPPRVVDSIPAKKDKTYAIILLSGYSTIPSAPLAFRVGTISLTTRSSTIVSTATQAASESCDIVGLRRAGSASITFEIFDYGRFIFNPTFPFASRAACKSMAMHSIFARFSGFSQACLLAINLVFV